MTDSMHPEWPARCAYCGQGYVVASLHTCTADGRRVAAHDAMIRGVRMGTECAAHRHSEWVPLEDHHIWPKGMGGPDVRSNIVRLCGNAHGAVHAYIDHLIRYGDRVPYETRRHFGPIIRAYATDGWQKAGSPRRG